MSTKALAKIEKEKDRQSLALRHLKEKFKASAENTLESAAVLGGGAAAGFIRAKYPNAQVAGVNTGLVVGIAATVVGVMDLAGKHSPMIGAFGEGALAYEVGARVAQSVKP